MNMKSVVTLYDINFNRLPVWWKININDSSNKMIPPPPTRQTFLWWFYSCNFVVLLLWFCRQGNSKVWERINTISSSQFGKTQLSTSHKSKIALFSRYKNHAQFLEIGVFGGCSKTLYVIIKLETYVILILD